MASTPQTSQVLPSTTKPSELEYGGDEISALVLDPGSAWTRCGFAGEDIPKTVIPSDYGFIVDPEAPKFGGKLRIGDNAVHSVVEGMEIRNPMKEGIVNDFEIATELWRHCIEYRLTSRAEDHPLLMTEPIWNPLKNREKTTEIVFEDFNVPAFYLVKSAVCTSFASSKGTALVIDVGHSQASVTPVLDGIPIKKGSLRSTLAGAHLNAQLRHQFTQGGINLTPHIMIKGKTPYVDLAQPPPALNYNWGFTPTDSFLKFQQDRIFLDFKETVSDTWIPHSNFTLPTDVNSMPDHLRDRIQQKPYEFPDGYNTTFGLTRFQAPESLFNPSVSPLPLETSASGSPPIGIGEMIKNSVGQLDADYRALMLNNIVVTGGTSLLYHFNERLNLDLTTQFPGPRVRIHAPGNIIERKYSAWLGGSILASLGTFHQLWISRQEYDEQGPNVIERRAK